MSIQEKLGSILNKFPVASTITGATGSAGGAFTWLQVANEVVGIVAGIVAIISGCFAIAVGYRTLKKKKFE